MEAVAALQPVRHDDPLRDDRAPTPIVIQAPPARRSVLGTALQTLVLLLLLAVLAGIVLVLFSLASLLGATGQAASSVTGGVGNVAAQAGRALGDAGRTLRDAADPAHPPLGFSHDTELSALRAIRVGDALPGGRDYALTLAEIRRRDGADSPDAAFYAVVHAELRQPRETKILGQVVRRDVDPRDYSVYKGESFRVGRDFYRVNWVSFEDQAVALGTYRQPDRVTGSLKFELD